MFVDRRAQSTGTVAMHQIHHCLPIQNGAIDISIHLRQSFIDVYKRQGLGRLEAEQECRRLELYQAQFQAALQEGEAAARTQSMLSHKLGLAAGLAAAILLG